jgi:hypothetical protein
MLELAFLHYSTIYLVGDALELIQNDPAFIDWRTEIVEKIFRTDEYRKEPFVFSDSKVLKFGGPRAEGSMLMQLLDPHNPKYAQTHEANKNPLTWMLRHASITADIRVTKDGQVSISYELHDVFNLNPQKGRTIEYNAVSSFLGPIWHDQMGASAPAVYAIWGETFSLSASVAR